MYSVSNNDKCNNPYSRSSLVCMFKDNVCDMNVCAGCCILCMCVRKHFYNNLHHHIMIPKSCFCHMNEHQDSITIMLYNNNGVSVYFLFLLIEMFFFKILFGVQRYDKPKVSLYQSIPILYSKMKAHLFFSDSHIF